MDETQNDAPFVAFYEVLHKHSLFQTGSFLKDVEIMF